MFIDQLGMIQDKTRGNLTNEETAVLRNALSNLQMAFVEVSRQVREGTTESATPAAPEAEIPEAAAPASAEKAAPAATPEGESESRKKFTKSYGA
jgi:hypothetical protein